MAFSLCSLMDDAVAATRMMQMMAMVFILVKFIILF
jgi:hypothetical protein